MLLKSQKPRSVRTKLVVPIRSLCSNGPVTTRREAVPGGEQRLGEEEQGLRAPALASPGPAEREGESPSRPRCRPPCPRSSVGENSTRKAWTARNNSFWKSSITSRKCRAERVISSMEMSWIKAVFAAA